MRKGMFSSLVMGFLSGLLCASLEIGLDTWQFWVFNICGAILFNVIYYNCKDDKK
jgi:hypothetical protein